MTQFEPQYSESRDDDHPNNWSRDMDAFSGVIAPLYKCPKCGEVWRVTHAEDIDTENDEVYEWLACSNCGSSVTAVLHDGHPVCHPLTVEEMYWDNYGEDEEDESDY